jgi:hypothetical protein
MLKPGPGAIIRNVDDDATKRVYYTYQQFHKVSKLTDGINKLLSQGENIDPAAVLVVMAKVQVELLDTSFNKKASVRFIQIGEENE